MLLRYATGQKEESRNRILAAAARRFRKDGITASGVAGVMNEAGLTNGAFYGHFESKDHLVRDAVSSALAKHNANWAHDLPAYGIEGTLRRYLSMEHRDNLAQGCPTAALVGEIARQPADTKLACTEPLQQLIGMIEAQLVAEGNKTARSSALAIFSQMLGAIQMARATGDPAFAQEILDAALNASLVLAQAPVAP